MGCQRFEGLFSETSVSYYIITRPHNPEDVDMNLRRRQNLKSHTRAGNSEFSENNEV
jgi:hypothetical protein